MKPEKLPKSKHKGLRKYSIVSRSWAKKFWDKEGRYIGDEKNGRYMKDGTGDGLFPRSFEDAPTAFRAAAIHVERLWKSRQARKGDPISVRSYLYPLGEITGPESFHIPNENYLRDQFEGTIIAGEYTHVQPKKKAPASA